MYAEQMSSLLCATVYHSYPMALLISLLSNAYSVDNTYKHVHAEQIGAICSDQGDTITTPWKLLKAVLMWAGGDHLRCKSLHATMPY